MADLTETATWEPGIYQLELSDPVEAGPDGIDNLQANQLANRTKYLKEFLASVINVKLLADGPDYTAAVQAAIDGADKPMLWFPAGDYTLGAIKLKANTTLLGEPGARILAMDNGVAWSDHNVNPLFYILDTESISNLRVEGLEFVRPGANSAKFAFYLPTNTGNSNIEIRSCTFDRIGAVFTPKTTGLRFTGNIVKDLWQNHAYHAGNYAVEVDADNAMYVLQAEGCAFVEVVGNRATNIFAFAYLNAGSSGGYGGNMNNCVIRDNFVKETADTCFMVRATSGVFDQLLYDGNQITDCGKTPIKAEINNDAGGNRFRGVVIVNNQMKDWGRYAGGECIMLKGALSVPTATKTQTAVISNNTAIKETYGAGFIQAANCSSLTVIGNTVENARDFATINYTDDLRIVGNRIHLEPGYGALALYGIDRAIVTDNNVRGSYDGNVAGYLDAVTRLVFMGNVIQNDVAAVDLTNVTYALRLNNTGGDGNASNSRNAIIANNYIYVPNLTFVDGFNTVEKRPFFVTLARVESVAIHSNALEDSTGIKFQGAMVGDISNLMYYYQNAGVLDKETDTENLRVAKGVSGHAYMMTAQGKGGAAPVAGTYGQGAIWLNSAPDPGEPIGWICTVAGTPGTWTPLFGLPKVRAVNAATVLTEAEDVVLLSGGVFTVTLPADHTAGKRITLKDTGTATASNKTVAAGAGDTIDGAASIVLDASYASITLVSDGANWHAIGQAL